MKLPKVLAVLIGIVVLSAISGCAGGSNKDGLLERATEAYKHVDGSESGWRKTYEYNIPAFRSQCSEDEYVNGIMSLSTWMLGYGAEYKVEVLRAEESGQTGTVTTTFIVENDSSLEEEEEEDWWFIDGAWWNASLGASDI